MSSDMYMNCRYMGEGTTLYKPGGFHLVHLGDVLDGRYRIFRKLGSGGQSTIWLGRDSSSKQEEEEDRKWMESYYAVQKEVKKLSIITNAKYEAIGKDD